MSRVGLGTEVVTGEGDDVASLADWFLTGEERGNPFTILDRRHGDGAAWSTGSRVEPLVHGAAYFTALLAALTATRAGDLVLFTDWRGDPDERLDGAGTEISTVLCEAASRGVVVRGLVWRSHLDRFAFSAAENRHLGEEIDAAGGQCLLDMRVRPGGSHHQKFVVIRCPGREHLDVAFVGGIDLCHSRRDDAQHLGDPQPLPIAAAYGPRPAWHDVQARITGPAVGDVEAVFRERWDDPTPLTRNPIRRLRDRVAADGGRRPLPPQAADPAPQGRHAVQLLRTYGYRGRTSPYPFAPRGERSVARGYLKALRRARSLIYLEDQYLWSGEVAGVFAESLRRNASLRMVAVLPRFPDQDGAVSGPPNLVGRIDALRELTDAAPGRVAIYSPENHLGVPVYVHAKVCVIDDVWACIGSDNVNLRSWTHDSELSCAVLDETRDERTPTDPGGLGDGARVFARDLRLRLAGEHLDLPDDDNGVLLDPASAFHAFARSAADLDHWYATDPGNRGPRPPGRLRPHPMPTVSASQQRWARPYYRIVYDPDGRPWGLRRARTF